MASSSVAHVTATITAVAGQAFATTFAAAPAVTKAASASILDPSHPDPTKFDPSDPIVLFIIQAAIIVALSRFLALFLGRIRQPRVISEVVAGIIVGPSIMGRVPGFTAHIFPPASLSYLNLVATIGLVLFVFIVGMEVDFALFKRNAKASTSIAAFGLIVPFALGAAVSVGLYERFSDQSKVSQGTFLLFIATAMAITALPVLARILTELQLLQNHLGVVVLSAGIGEDVIGWVLLALAIALVNASAPITVLYVILCAIGWVLVLVFIGRPLLVLACRRTGSFGEKGPTQGIVCSIIFLVLGSSWITDRIGIHAIFGGLLVGLIVPNEIRAGITEKIEDLVACLFLPLFFALSGLKTDLGLLASGEIWGWTACVVLVAFLSKFLSCGVAAKVSGMDWRESGAVGSLMACKGLVELIVLNIGLSAGILENRVFAMFVFMALVTTFLSTPLTLLFYPPSYRLEKERLRKAALAVEGQPHESGSSTERRPISRLAIVLDRYEHLAAVLSVVSLFKSSLPLGVGRPASTATSSDDHDEKSGALPPHTGMAVSTLRLIELSDRTSSLVQASASPNTLLALDSLTQIFRTFSLSVGLPTTSALAVIGRENFSTTVATHAAESASELVVLPWILGAAPEQEGLAESMLPNPFDTLFKRGGNGSSGREGAPQYAGFVRSVFADTSCAVALYLGNVVATPSNGASRLFFAFHGGSDDRAALALVVQLATANPGLTAQVVRVLPAEKSEENLVREATNSTEADDAPVLLSQFTVGAGGSAVDTVYPAQNRLSSESADTIALQHWFSVEPSAAGAHPEAVQDAIRRIEFTTVASSQPLHLSVARASAYVASSNTPTTIVVGRSRQDAPSHSNELALFLKSNVDTLGLAGSSEVRRCLGDLGSALVAARIEGVAGVLVLQSGSLSGTRQDV